MTPRVLEPTPDQAEDVVVVELGDGWELIVTEGAAVVLAPRERNAIAVLVGSA